MVSHHGCLAEMVKAAVLRSAVEIRAGSSPAAPTKKTRYSK